MYFFCQMCDITLGWVFGVRPSVMKCEMGGSSPKRCDIIIEQPLTHEQVKHRLDIVNFYCFYQSTLIQNSKSLLLGDSFSSFGRDVVTNPVIACAKNNILILTIQK